MNKSIQTPENINQLTVIGYDTEPMKWSEWAQSAGVNEYRPTVALQFEQMYFALQAANEGLGVVLVPLFLVADDIATGKLCAPFGMLGARQRKYYAVSRIKVKDNPMIKVFYEWLSRESIETEKKMKKLLMQQVGS